MPSLSCISSAATECWRESGFAARGSLIVWSILSSAKGQTLIMVDSRSLEYNLTVQTESKLSPNSPSSPPPPHFRYAILAPKAIPQGFMDGRKATELLLEALQLDMKDFRLGHSKVFFKAGVLGHLEDLRDETLAKVLTNFQSYARGYLMRKKFKKMQEQR